MSEPRPNSQRCQSCDHALVWNGKEPHRFARCGNQESPRYGEVVRHDMGCRCWRKSH